MLVAAQISPAVPFLGFYAAQIALSVFVLMTMPKNDSLSERLQKYRQGAIALGFIPCGGLMLFIQIPYLILYKLGESRQTDQQRRLQGRLVATGFDAPGAGQPRASSSPAANPFDTDQSQEAQRPSTAGPSSDNPFM